MSEMGEAAGFVIEAAEAVAELCIDVASDSRRKRPARLGTTLMVFAFIGVPIGLVAWWFG